MLECLAQSLKHIGPKRLFFAFAKREDAVIRSGPTIAKLG